MMTYSNKINTFLLLTSFLLTFVACSSDEGNGNDYLTFTSDVELLPKGTAPEVVTSLKELTLKFNEPISQSTLEKNITISKLIPEDGSLEDVTSTMTISLLAGSQDIVVIHPNNNQEFEAGICFQVSISQNLESLASHFLQTPFEGYFYTSNLLAEVYPSKNEIVIISDLHLGDPRSIEKGYCWFIDNRPYLIEFLDYLIAHKTSIKALVINGDMIDEWVAPMDTPTFADAQGNKLTEEQFFGEIVKANQAIVDKFKEVKAAGIEIVYVPGNHDMLTTASDFDKYFGKGVITQARDKAGLGKYEPTSDIVIEHGHRYDFYNAPDPLSNKNIDNVTAQSILPPGFFVTKVASTADLENANIPRALYRSSGTSEDKTKLNIDNNTANQLAYIASWVAILAKKPVKNMDAPILTGIDGYTGEYKLSDVVPSKSYKLYTDTHLSAKWAQRSVANGASPHVPFAEAIVAGAFNFVYEYLAYSQYYWNKKVRKQIVVFGHTHEAALTRGYDNCYIDATLYANPGTWIDKKWVGEKEQPRTFITIEAQELDNHRGYIFPERKVKLQRFHSKNNIELIKQRVIWKNW